MPITSPNMGLVVPIASSGVTGTGDSGPAYAQEISNDLLTIIDQHGHIPGQGVQIVPAALNLNTDISVQSNNINVIRATRFVSQASALSGVGDVNQTYVVNGNLYFNNAAGQAIQLTSGVATAVSATGLATGTQFYQAGATGSQSITTTNAQVLFAGLSTTGYLLSPIITQPISTGSGSANFVINSNGLYEISYKVGIQNPTGAASGLIQVYQTINATGVLPPAGVGTLVAPSINQLQFNSQPSSPAPAYNILSDTYVAQIASGSNMQTWLSSTVANYALNATGTRFTITKIG